MIRDDVHDDAEIERARRANEPVECSGAAELGADARRVGLVVSVRAAGNRLEDRRQVEVRDTEIGKKGNDRGGVVEAERRRQLQPVGGPRNRHSITLRT